MPDTNPGRESHKIISFGRALCVTLLEEAVFFYYYIVASLSFLASLVTLGTSIFWHSYVGVQSCFGTHWGVTLWFGFKLDRWGREGGVLSTP